MTNGEVPANVNAGSAPFFTIGLGPIDGTVVDVKLLLETLASILEIIGSTKFVRIPLGFPEGGWKILPSPTHTHAKQ